MNPQLTKPQWCALPIEVRNKLREIFKINRSEGCEIVSDKLMSDGTSHIDLQAINVASMQTYLNSEETDFAKLFDEVLSLVNPVEAPIAEGTFDGVIEEMPKAEETIPEPIKEILSERSLNANKKTDAKTKETDQV